MIIRTPGRDRYTIISKVPLEDSRLSWKARGLLSYLLSKPDNWNVIVSHLVNEAPDGRDSIFAGLKELEDSGYIRRSRKRMGSGRFDGLDTEVFEEPTTIGLAVNGLSVYGKPDANEEGLLKNNNINEIRANETDLDLSGERPVNSKNSYSEDFETIWKVYPRKTNKQGAYRKFVCTLKKPDVDYETLLSSVIAYSEEMEGEEERFILHGKTFFGPEERWRDWAVEPKTDSEREFETICSVIYDQWDTDMSWFNPDTGEESRQNPSIGGYKRPRGPKNSFVASDGTLYEFDPSGRRVAL